MPFPLRPLCFGLVLGAAFTWLFLDASASDPLATRHSSLATSAALPAWSPKDSSTPPALTRDEADAAVAAWLALRDSSKNAPGYPARAAALRTLLVLLPAEAFPRLIDGLAASAGDDDKRLFDLAFSTWIRRDAPASVGWAAARWTAPRTGNVERERFRELAFEAMRAWSGQDAHAAATWAATTFPDADAGISLAIRPLCTLAETSPERALALASSFGADFRKEVLPAISQSLAKKDPVGTLRSLGPELCKNGHGIWMLRPAIDEWMKQDAAAALPWLLALPRDDDRYLSILFSVRDNTPGVRRSVADALATTPGVPHRAETLRNLFSFWSTDAPGEAIAWLDELPDSDLRIDILENASYSRYTPETSLPLALVMPEGANRTERLALLLGAWAKNDSDAALAWMRENGAQTGVNEAAYAVHGALLADLAREDPQAAVAEWQTLDDPKTRFASVDSIARVWGQRDPAAAFQWAETQHQAAPTRSYGDNADLLSKWAKSDPETALRWVEDWQAGLPEDKRDLSRGYYDSLGGTPQERYPRAATADLYSKISDATIRSDTLARHVGEWLTKDPAAARAWVESHDALPPGQAAALLAPAK